jgi:hypothetical protein
MSARQPALKTQPSSLQDTKNCFQGRPSTVRLTQFILHNLNEKKKKERGGKKR